MIDWIFVIIAFALFAVVVFLFGAPTGTAKKFFKWIGLIK